MNLTLEHHSQDGAEIVEVNGDLDIYTAEGLRSLLLDLDLAAACYRIVLDLSECKFMDATGLGVIMGALKRARARDGWLAVSCTSEGILHVLRVTGLLGVLNVYGSPDEAIAAKAPAS